MAPLRDGTLKAMSQSAKTRRRGPNSLTVRVLLVFGFLLAVGATVVVVFSEDVRWLRLAVLLGLWAALIAAYAVARSHRDARNAEQREGEVGRVYELELQREVSARREFEMKLAESSRDEAQTRRDDELAALREQLDRLTSMLSGLVDGDLLSRRLTLSAESTRIRSISDPALGRLTSMTRQQLVEAGAGGGLTVEHLDGPAWGPQPAPVLGPARPLPASAAPSAEYARGPRVAGPLGFEGSSDQTEQISRITDDGPIAFPTGPQPVIDAAPATPRVVGQPRSDLTVESAEPETDVDIVDAELVEVRAEPDAEPESDEAVVVESLVVESVVVETVVVGSDPIESAVVESDRSSQRWSSPQPSIQRPSSQGRSRQCSSTWSPRPMRFPSPTPRWWPPNPSPSRLGRKWSPSCDPTPAVVDNSYLSLISESSAGYRRRAAGRPDAPSTAWTIDHRRSTPAAPASDVPSRSRPETRAAAAAAEATATATADASRRAASRRRRPPRGPLPTPGTAIDTGMLAGDTGSCDRVKTPLDAPEDTTAEDTVTAGSDTAPATAAVDTVDPTPGDVDTGHSSGVSVAELVAAYGTGRPPRRRRYADDTD